MQSYNQKGGLSPSASQIINGEVNCVVVFVREVILDIFITIGIAQCVRIPLDKL